MDGEKDKVLWVGNVSEQVTEELLWELFLQAGPLEKVVIPKDRDDGRKKNFAFVTFKHIASVPFAMNIMGGTKLFNQTLNLKTKTGSSHDSNRPFKGVGLLPHRNMGIGLIPPLKMREQALNQGNNTSQMDANGSQTPPLPVRQNSQNRLMDRSAPQETEYSRRQHNRSQSCPVMNIGAGGINPLMQQQMMSPQPHNNRFLNQMGQNPSMFMSSGQQNMMMPPSMQEQMILNQQQQIYQKQNQLRQFQMQQQNQQYNNHPSSSRQPWVGGGGRHRP